MGLFDDLKPAVAGQKGLFGDLVPAQGEQPKNIAGELVRQVGLTARYGLEGLPQVADTLVSPLKYLTDKSVNAATGADMNARSPTLSEMGTGFSDWLGLPKPQTAQERVVGDMTRTGFGAMGGAGLARGISSIATGPITQGVANTFAANPGTQLIAAGGAGAGAGIVRENGGSPVGQTLAALAGGIAAPVGARLVQNAGQAAMNAIRQSFGSTQVIDATLKSELAKTGVNWDELSANVKLQLRKDAEAAVYSNQKINSEAVKRLADYRNIGATPLVGDITQDPALITQQRNLSKQLANIGQPVGGTNLPNIDNSNAKRVLSTLEGAATSSLDEIGTGQRITDRIRAADTAAKAAEDAQYAAARAAAGREIPLDRSAFINQAYANLANSNRGSFLPKEVETLLNQISAGRVSIGGKDHPVPFNVDTIDQLKTVLSSASRATQDGNVKAAIAQVRNALENTGVAPAQSGVQGGVTTGPQAAAMRTGDTLSEESLRLFDTARATARGRREWQESAKFIEDAINGVPPDKFVQKHVLGAPVESLAGLKKEIQADPEATNAIRKQLVDYILKRGGADSDVTRFSSKGMEDGLKQLGDRKLALFFSPEEIQQIKSAVSVGKYMQAQPIGSAVNNSNSGALVLGKISDMLLNASPIPMIGPMAADPIRGLTLRAQTIPLRNLSSGLTEARPSPGVTKPTLVPLAALLAGPAINQNQDKRGQ